MIQNMSLAGLAAETKAEFAYSGAYTLKQITSGGVTYDLYTLTGSGTLTVTGTAKNVDIWACGGGATYSHYSGGAGAYCAQVDAQSLRGDYVVSIGSSGGNTSVGSLVTANGATTANGGTGGGGGNIDGLYNAPTGDGKTKYPFGDTTNFQCHCAGGGGGGVNYSSDSQTWQYNGGAGGSNGGNGATSTEGIGDAGAGGSYGGGQGGSRHSKNGKAATFYGSGGGGYGAGSMGANGPNTGTAGAGYQGVVYIRVPA